VAVREAMAIPRFRIRLCSKPTNAWNQRIGQPDSGLAVANGQTLRRPTRADDSRGQQSQFR